MKHLFLVKGNTYRNCLLCCRHAAMHVDRSSWSWTIVVLLLVSLQENIMVVTQSEQVEEVRLVGGSHRCEGRLEVQYNGRWGTVCDDKWDMVDADVVCRQLGCGSSEWLNSRFGPGTGPILLDDVGCTGNETSISECPNLGWNVHNCSHYEDVSLTCKEDTTEDNGALNSPHYEKLDSGDGGVRLVNGNNPCEGRLEVFYQGNWGTVCDDDWDLRDANVVCRQIGCGHGVALHYSSVFDHGTDLILLDNVNCHGSESNLTECSSMGWLRHNCGHHEDVGLTCSGTSGNRLIVSLIEDLLHSLETQTGAPNPSIYLALRLSAHHNLSMERAYLERLLNEMPGQLQNSTRPVTGLLALFILSLRASCHDLDIVLPHINGGTASLLTHMERQMHLETMKIHDDNVPLSNFYQYSLGVIALCTADIQVDRDFTEALINAVEQQQFTHGDYVSIDTYALAGIALQCVEDSLFPVYNGTKLDTALSKIKGTILDSQRPDGHLGNEFSTGNAVQALIAMGSSAVEFIGANRAIWSAVRGNVYHNPMGISQILPALQGTSYLTIKTMTCLNEDDSVVVEPLEPVVVLPNENTVGVAVEVVMSNGSGHHYLVDVPLNSTLLHTLELLQEANVGFTFGTTPSLWGPYLSVVNGVEALSSERQYWHLSSNGVSLTEGIGDYKIEYGQTITIAMSSY
ncbi:transcobalamin-2-like isoform X2 [Cynoglossus semilaevis]|nr:transcobalamin-2-like isoform X2 [Cynoglossus semilaevis]